jgi:SlyX protein
MREKILELIETKIAYLERANADLSDVVFRQQREIQALADALAAQSKLLTERLQAVEREERLPSLDEERPPHY